MSTTVIPLPIENKAAAVVKAIKEINDLWNAIYREHNNNVIHLIQKGHNVHLLFCKYMRNVSTVCEDSGDTLEKIIQELSIAKELKRFDRNVAKEIKISTDELLNAFKTKKEEGQAIAEKIINCQDSIMEEKEGIRMKNIKARLQNNLYSATAGGSAGMAFASKVLTHTPIGRALILGGVGGASILVGISELVSFFKMKNFKKLADLLEQLLEQIEILQTQSDEFSVLIEDVTARIKNYVASAEKNVKYSYDSSLLIQLDEENAGNEKRVVIMAGGMIKDTEKLRDSFEKIKAEARKNEGFMRKQILQYNPRALLIEEK